MEQVLVACLIDGEDRLHWERNHRPASQLMSQLTGEKSSEVSSCPAQLLTLPTVQVTDMVSGLTWDVGVDGRHHW